MTKIDRVRKILTEKQAAKIDGKMVDTFTAGAIMAVYEKLSPENQAKFVACPIAKMGVIAFRLMK